MPEMGFLVARKAYRIDFVADALNVGASVVNHYWVPRQGKPAPAVQPSVSVDPGQTGKQNGQVPEVKACLRLVVSVDLPKAGKGKLTVTDGVKTWSEDVGGVPQGGGQAGEEEEEVDWSFRISPPQP